MAKKAKRAPRRKRHPIKEGVILLLLSMIQVITFSQTAFDFSQGFDVNLKLLLCFSVYIAVEWLYVIIMKFVFKRINFEIELIAFFLTGIGLSVLGSTDPDSIINQSVCIILGIGIYTVLVWILSDIDRAVALRLPVGIAAILILVANIFLGSNINGAKNWIMVGNLFSVQPSELVKIAFIFVGAATLEKLQTSKNLFLFIGFSAACVGILFILQDFGTAVIFFLTFLLIAFMRSGELRTVFLAIASAVLGGLLIVKFKPYVTKRFAVYRHVWEEGFIDAGGYQQSRTLIAISSGGLFGLGLGNGALKNVTFSSTDLVFGVVCEELGLITGLMILASFILFCVFAVKNARMSRSAFYSIAATAAAGLLLIQACINIFGVTDIIPLTGVTLPFISRGGSSIMSCWGLLAFIKAGDVRTMLKTYGEIRKK